MNKSEQATSACLIGAGNVATHLAHALQAAGYNVRGVYSRTDSHALELAQSLGKGTMHTDHVGLLPEADIYIFSVKDDALPQLAQTVARVRKGSKRLFLHTAGSVPLATLSEHFENAAVLYPMQTFSRTRQVDFKSVPIFVEGSNTASLQAVTTLAHDLSTSVTQLDSTRRRTLHLSAVFASNFANHCYTLAYDLLHNAGIDPQCLLPLIDETAAKVHELHPAEAQTGPAIRWDAKVMQRQTELLADTPSMCDIYRAMSDSIHRRANGETHE